MASIHRALVLITVSLVGLVRVAQGQCPHVDGNHPIAASPTRPLITDGADVIDIGVMEVETGWTSAWPGGGVRQDSFGSLYKMGLFCNFEFRAFGNAFEGQMNPGGGNVSGKGDVWYSGQYRFLNQTKKLPSLAMIYAAKQPLASVTDGLGSGKVDHLVALAALKTYGKMTYGFESKAIFSGQQVGSGHDKNAEVSFFFTRPLIHKTAIVGEIYGDTEKNASTPGFASNLWALQYNFNSRLVFDAGIDVGITNGAPHKRAFGGVSYAVSDLYKALRHRQASPQSGNPE